jgi:hypothetical protein
MVTGDGHARHHCFSFALGGDIVRRERVANDAIVDLGVNHPIVECDAGAAMAATRDRFTEPFDDVGAPAAILVLQRDDKPARWNGAVVVIDATPRVDVERSVRRERHLAGVADIIGENCSAETFRESDAGRVALATDGGGLAWRRCRP